MSLEVAIAKLTASIDALIAKLEAHDALPKASQPKAAAAPSGVTAAASPAAAAAPTVVAAAPAAPVKYDPDLVSAKVAINRAAVIELLDAFGAKKGPQVKEADIPQFMAALAKIEKAT